MIRTQAAVAALAAVALLGAPLAAQAGTVASKSMKDGKGDVAGAKKLRQAKSVDLSRVTYKHVEAGGEDFLVVQYKIRAAFGRKAGLVQSFSTRSDTIYFQSRSRSNGTVGVWTDELEDTVPCDGATEKVDRRRDIVTQRVPASCLGGVTKGNLTSEALVLAPRSKKVAVDFSDDSRRFSWGTPAGTR
jgi:hypothetical protein